MPGAAAGFHFEVPGLCGRFEQAEVASQLAFGFLRRAERGAVHVAVAEAVRERDFPRPAVAHRGGYRLRGDRLTHRRGHRHRRIVEQVIGVRDERRSQRLLDQQARESAAIDEEVRGDGLAVAGGDRRDVAALHCVPMQVLAEQ